jgi:hypothetical protein
MVGIRVSKWTWELIANFRNTPEMIQEFHC